MKLDHVAVVVSDLKASLDFYVGFLGLTVKREFDLSEEESRALFHFPSPAHAVQLLFDEGMLELFSFETDTPDKNVFMPGLFHFAVQVGRPLEDFMAAAKERGVPVSSIERNGKTVYFVRDPDGVFIEVKP